MNVNTENPGAQSRFVGVSYGGKVDQTGEIGQRHTAHAARIALDAARQGGPRMGGRSQLGWLD